jgi:hypothetical protein
MAFSSRNWVLSFLLCATSAQAANPLTSPIATFNEWKERLFGARAVPVEIEEAPAEGAVLFGLDRPQHFLIDDAAEQREFPKGKSRYRELELQREFKHVALRVQVIAQRSAKGRGNTVFKPILYVLADDGSVRESKPIEPLYLDIRPFKPSRLLACVPLENVRRLALATTPSDVGKFYESASRSKLKAPTKSGFYYATEPVNVKLPYADTGDFVIEVTQEVEEGKGC